MKKTVLSMGSNMGDREGFLTFGVSALSKLAETEVTMVSHVYETSPWGNTEQDDFLNICVEIETSLSPEALLQETQRIEHEAGRVRSVHWGPRTLDIDIIICEGECRDTEELTIPHPRFTQRAFVLRPMAELYPELIALGVKFTLPPEGEKGERVTCVGRLEL